MNHTPAHAAPSVSTHAPSAGRRVTAVCLAAGAALSLYIEFFVLLPAANAAVLEFPEVESYYGWGVAGLVSIAALLQIALLAFAWGLLSSPRISEQTPRWARVSQVAAAAAFVLLVAAFISLSTLGFLSAGLFLLIAVSGLASLVFVVSSTVFWATRR